MSKLDELPGDAERNLSAPCPLIVFDLETGGLDRRVHPVIQFAGVAVDTDWKIHEEVQIKIHFDQLLADPEALKVNSFDPGVWARDAVSEEYALQVIADFFRRHASWGKISKRGKPYKVARLCGHNSSLFDGEFLAAWFKRNNLFCPAACYETLDTRQLAYWTYYLIGGPPPKNFKLETLCERHRIDLDNAHDALADVKATVRLARILSRPGVFPNHANSDPPIAT